MDGDLRASQGHRLAQSHAAHCGAELKSEVRSSRTRAGSPQGASKLQREGGRRKGCLEAATGRPASQKGRDTEGGRNRRV